MFTPSEYSALSASSNVLSSTVTSTRSMSDFAQTGSCDRLPQSTAARIERSPLMCSINDASAAAKCCSIGPGSMPEEFSLSKIPAKYDTYMISCHYEAGHLGHDRRRQPALAQGAGGREHPPQRQGGHLPPGRGRAGRRADGGLERTAA